MKNIIIMGMPAAGKGTVCKHLVSELGFYHISTGVILREEQEAGTAIGKMADRLIDTGNYMPDNIMIPLLKQRVMDSDNTVGVLFDGFPRTMAQAKQLSLFLMQRRQPLAAVICLDVDKKIAIDRIMQRSLTEGRADDDPKVVGNRVNQYVDNTAPLIDHYDKMGLVHRVNANPEKEVVYGVVRKLIEQLP